MTKKEYNCYYWAKNRERLLQKNKEWKQNNRERTNELNRKSYYNTWQKHQDKNRRWAKNHRKRVVEFVQGYVRRNKEKVTNYNKRFNQTIEGKYRLLFHRHNKKWQEPIITLEDFKIISSQPCMYCGGETNKGIDRVDNTQGYTKENSAPCCAICNYMKRTMTTEEFMNHINKIHQYHA